MSTWGVKPWESDYAADWFANFFGDKSLSVGADLVFKFNFRDELQYHQVRAFAFVLQSLGRPYVWPESDEVDAKELIERTIEILENMIDPSLKDWTFLNSWDDSAEVVDEVRLQISELRKRNSEWISF